MNTNMNNTLEQLYNVIENSGLTYADIIALLEGIKVDILLNSGTVKLTGTVGYMKDSRVEK